ncbi:MAG: hypothetical protein HQK73_03855 [Desulfamplus sp.]|nr:hypothetical protein [Desulfamplus sp.]
MGNSRLEEIRKDVQNWLEGCLIGPFGKPLKKNQSNTIEEELHFRPSEMYQCGILYGQMPDLEIEIEHTETKISEDETFEDDDNSWGVENDTKKGAKAKKASISCHYRPPSGVGLSFFVSSDISIEVIVQAARYLPITRSRKDNWVRRQLPDNNIERQDIIRIKPSENDQQLSCEINILSDRELNKEGDSKRKDVHFDTLHVKWRPYNATILDDSGKKMGLCYKQVTGYIVTISVVNRASVKEINSEWVKTWEKTHLFQLLFECHIISGEVYPYPGNDMLQLEQEDREFALLYSDKAVFAIGHGVSPEWETDKDSRVKCVKADFLPSSEVPLMETDVKEIDKAVLNLSTLSKTEKNVDVIQKILFDFTSTYQKWITKLQSNIKNMSKEQIKTADTMLGRLEKCTERMNKGIKSLKEPFVAKAFSFAHIAMIDYMRTRGVEKPFWRPFQLGFLLQEIPSLIDDNDSDRDVVDLLWFQTGGGKTEAYLAIISFLVAYRRMRYSNNGGGTTVIMRYTLRLLTIQQFQRASIVICALELLRRKYPEILGQIPITAGLWVGAASSPNDFSSANKIVQGALKSDGYGLEKFVITECPWCGSKLKVNSNCLKSAFLCDDNRFVFCCTNSKCEFGGSDNPVLPVSVVDQHLYQNPPTLLLATVDKFAMFTWREETTVFLGNSYLTPLYSVPAYRPPDLIIQDELHLISGELGTIAGLYESGFDAALKIQGHSVKYIASTATIRNAKEQVKKLYARDVSVFPSPGLNWSDSFFARVDNVKPGRLYIGYYTPNLGRTESFAPLAAALFTAPSIWNYSDEAVKDAWWTMVAYHGSLRGLGITHNLVSDEVNKYINYYIGCMVESNFKGTNEYAKSFDQFCTNLNLSYKNLKQLNEGNYDDYKNKVAEQFIDFRRLYAESGIAELTSNRNASEIRKYLSELDTCYSDENNHAISLLLCTNMVSVGLDISRLGLMVINGQPFTTGEYIQASSRVGRNQVPGIVVAHYFRNHARDMSHYENFRSYHESFYRFVEPTSLTPFSAPSRKRALHSALVIVIRHAAGLLGNDAANNMDKNDVRIKNAVDIFLQRCKKASPEQFENTKKHIEQLICYWDSISGQNNWDIKPLQYQTPSDGRKDKLALLISYSKKREMSISEYNKSWATLQSMRSVDDECGIIFITPRNTQ